jgi:uncharacterized protein YdbL (DUF1318 family)
LELKTWPYKDATKRRGNCPKNGARRRNALIKAIALAAVAAFAISAPASASEIRVATNGKSVAQLDTEITAAANTVCKRDSADDIMAAHARKACYRVSVQAAKVQLQQFAAAEGQKLAAR